MSEWTAQDLPLTGIVHLLLAVILPEYSTEGLATDVYTVTYTAGKMDEFKSRRVVTWVLTGTTGNRYRNYLDLIEYSEAAPIVQALHFLWRLAANTMPAADYGRTYEVFENDYRSLIDPPTDDVVMATIVRAMDELASQDPGGTLALPDLVLSLRWPQGSIQRALNRLDARRVVEADEGTEGRRYRIVNFDLAQGLIERFPTSNPSEVANSQSSKAPQEATYDVFLSHASEDKAAIARPLFDALNRQGASVWYDEAVLELGDSLRTKIDQGLRVSRFGVVILSRQFFDKGWPQRELDGLVARETASGQKAILPVWHGVDRDEVLQFSAPLADRLAARSSDGIERVAEMVMRVVRGS